MRTEGDGATRLIELLRGPKRQETVLVTAQVTNVEPISIRLPGYRDDIPEEAIVIAEELRDHERTMREVPGGAYITYSIKSPLSVGDAVIVAIVDDGQTIYLLAKEAI